MKCRRCDSEEELVWNQPYKKGDFPVRGLDGKPHECRNNRQSEISSSTIKKPEDKLFYPDGVTEKLKSNDTQKCYFRGSYRENNCFRRKESNDIYCEIHGYTQRAQSGGIKEKFLKREEKITESLE
jgi:hypothetical protein